MSEENHPVRMQGGRAFGVGSVRSMLVAGLSLVALILLVWMYTEQGHIRSCQENVAKLQDAAELPNQSPPINVVVQMPPGDNKTVVNTPVEKKWNYNWDKKDWADPKEANGVPMRTIILVRHGQYQLENGHLTELGRQQANLTGYRLKELGMSYDRIIHSTMDRAVETAQQIHAHLPNLHLQSDDMIMEGGPLPPDPPLSYWGLPDRTYFVDGPRLEAAFRKYFFRADKAQQSETIDILVGHGNIFRYFILRALQLQEAAWMRVFIPHASISLLHINPDGTVTLTKFGDSGHFPPNMITI